jgi:O-antigen/teichoic acid export membrane protein
LLGGIAQALVARKLLPNMALRIVNINRNMAAELVRYCSVLTFFSVAMLLISGLDVTIVGYFSFSAVGTYSIAATLIAFFTGLNSAVFYALVSPVAVLQVRHDYGQIRRIILSSTRLNTYASLLLTTTTIAFGAPLLRLWVGQAYATRALPILEVLMLGQTVRLTGSASSWSLSAMGAQRLAVPPAAVEAVSNLTLSLFGILWLGPIGVAWGTLAAAILALSYYVFYTIGKAHSLLNLGRSQFLREGVVRPVMCFMPLVLCAAFAWQRILTPVLLSIWAACLLLSLLIAWRRGQLIPEGLFRRVEPRESPGDLPI